MCSVIASDLPFGFVHIEEFCVLGVDMLTIVKGVILRGIFRLEPAIEVRLHMSISVFGDLLG